MKENNKEVFARNLSIYMIDKGVDRSKLSEDLGFKYSTVCEWLSAKKYPRIDKIEMMANYFGIQKSDLIERKNDKQLKNAIPYDPSDMVQIPILGSVAAGLACQCDDNIIGYELVQRSSITSGEDYVFLKVKGDSMEPLLMEDDLVLVKCVDSVDSGDYAVMIVDGEDGLIKQVKYDKHSVTLVSANPYYPPRVFKGDEELSRLRVFGKVVESKRKF